jgi:hypothetical protein
MVPPRTICVAGRHVAVIAGSCPSIRFMGVAIRLYRRWHNAAWPQIAKASQ